MTAVSSFRHSHIWDREFSAYDVEPVHVRTIPADATDASDRWTGPIRAGRT
jgi:hypothetical protein